MIIENVVETLQRKTIRGKGEVFLHPGKAHVVGELGSDAFEFHRMIAVVNGLGDKYTDETKIVQLMITSNDAGRVHPNITSSSKQYENIVDVGNIHCDNLRLNGFSFDVHINGEGYVVYVSTEDTSYVPAELLKDVKEGDTFVVKFNMPLKTLYLELKDGLQDLTNQVKDIDNVKVAVELELTASQLKYKYSKFGPFEELYAKVLS